MVFLDTTCVTTITAGTLNSFELAWSTSHLYVQTFSRSSYKLQVGLFLHCLSLKISLYWIHFYGLWSSSGNTRHALKLKNLVFLETSRQGESENHNAPRKFGHVTFWTTLMVLQMKSESPTFVYGLLIFFSFLATSRACWSDNHFLPGVMHKVEYLVARISLDAVTK